MSEEELKKEMEEEIKNKMDTFIECYKNGMIFGSPTDIEFYEKIATLQQKVEQLEKENKELNKMCELYGQSLYNADLTKAEKRVEQLENIRKEAIKYINENWGHWCSNHCEYATETINILNKGSEE